jgi:NAD(P)-binding Rossmann-like domain
MSTVGNREIDVVVGDLEFDPTALKRKYENERDKRIVPEGHGQYVPAIEGRFADYGKDPWVTPGLSRAALTDHTAVIVAGGGFGGLLVGARLREAGIIDVRIIDEAGDFGGTWYWNRYPGAMCDIEAHIYMPLLEELNHAPKHRYAYAPEMLELSRKIGKRYGLYEKACFQTVITGARWLEAVDAYTEIIRSAPANKVLVNFYSSCTPGYYNGEGKGAKSEDLFFGNRYGGGAMAFYQMLGDWRRENNLQGMKLQ